ncbi:MAG: hypothetical protein J6Q65_05370 [Lentisphaeria bacterium]|nr:hypothetical protein [Lentisphaeria bacterium]
MTERMTDWKIGILFLLSILFSACSHIPDAGPLPEIGTIAPAPAAPTILYIPGWQSQQGAEYEEMVRNRQKEEIDWLEKTFPGSPVIYVSWNNAVSWNQCVENVSDLVKRMNRILRTLKPDQQKNVILAGHSLGGRAVIQIMALLNRKKITLRQGIALAAAIPDDSPDIEKALNASADPFINLYSPTDGTLRLVLGFIDNRPPLGAYGNARSYPADRFLQYRVEPHYKGDADWIHNHWSVFYLEHLHKILSAPELPPNEIHPPEKKLKIPHKVKGTYQTDANLFTWNTLRRFQGWRIQEHTILPFRYRILDRRDFIRAEGGEEEMTTAFDAIVRQLNAPAN